MMVLPGLCCLRKVFPFSVLMEAISGAGWDSVHVFEAVDHARSASYKLTSTVMLHMTTSTPTLGSMNLSGNLTRQVRLASSV
jgi:F-actin capping protein, beta subunit